MELGAKIEQLLHARCLSRLLEAKVALVARESSHRSRRWARRRLDCLCLLGLASLGLLSLCLLSLRCLEDPLELLSLCLLSMELLELLELHVLPGELLGLSFKTLSSSCSSCFMWSKNGWSYWSSCFMWFKKMLQSLWNSIWRG